MNLHQERLLILVDHYQRCATDTLQRAKAAHDVAFCGTATIEQLVVSLGEAVDAVAASHQALIALRGILGLEPDLPAGPSMGAPILLRN